MSKPTIYYYARVPKKAAGGTRIIYHHVDMLNELGFNAYVLHERRLFSKPSCKWFKHNTKIKFIKDLKKFQFGPNDFLVMPELYGPDMAENTKAENIVIFNLNAYYTFRGGYDLIKEHITTPYTDPRVKAIMTLSKDSSNYLSYAFPHLTIYEIPPSIDSSIFKFSNQKKKQIVFMPRKSRQDLLQVINILKMRNALNDYELISVDNCSEKEVATILKDASIFLCFGTPEGFQLPPAEALACGCIVIGYHGQAAQEFMRRDFSYPLEVGHITEFSKTVETIIKDFERNSNAFDKKRKTGADFIANNYSIEIEKNKLLKIWTALLA